MIDPSPSGGLDWGLVALLASIAACLVWGLRFFLRYNRKDLDSLKEELRADARDDHE